MSNEEYNGVADFGGDFDAVVGYPYSQAVPIRRKKFSPRGFTRAGYNRMGKTLEEEEEEEEEDEEEVSESTYNNNVNSNMSNNNGSNGSEVTQESAADVADAIKNQKQLKKKKKKKHSFKALFANLSDTGNNNNSEKESAKNKNSAVPVVVPAPTTTSAEETELRRRHTELSSSPKHYRTVPQVASNQQRRRQAMPEYRRPSHPEPNPEVEQDEEVDFNSGFILPRLPRGKKMVDTVVSTDVDSLYKNVFDNDTFFEIVGSKSYEHFRNFQCSPWAQNRETGLFEREMSYDISKTIAFSRQNVLVEQTQLRASYCRRGLVYGVDTVTQNSGVVYSDYFVLNIHYRCQAVSETHSQLIVVVDIEFVKPCLFKGRIEAEAWSGLKKYYDMVDKEVRLERDSILPDDTDPNAATDEGGKKRLKEMRNYQRMVSMNQQLLRQASMSQSDEGDGGDVTTISRASEVLVGYFSPETILAAFAIIITTLLLMTMAMYKLSSTVMVLEERVHRLESVLDRNRGMVDLLLQTADYTYSNRRSGDY